MIKYTSGPWKEAYGKIEQVDTEAIVMDEGCGCCGARTTNEEEHEANVRLMATSPCMYEELARTKGILEDLLDGLHLRALLSPAIERIDAVLAKAKGGSDKPTT